MIRNLLSAILMALCLPCFAQEISARYEKTAVMIPMRDGVQLFTIILKPSDSSTSYPFILQRTPYGVQNRYPETDAEVTLTKKTFNFPELFQEGFIFVFQDVRGKYRSQGKMEIHQPLIHRTVKGAVDESTDTWDTIEWLLHHVSGNNGKVGLTGVSYPGWLTLTGSEDPHPALKAASEQACMADLFLGDDFHHNGAFRLSYGMEYTYELETDGTKSSDFPFPAFDVFDWYRNLGSLKNVNDKYFHGKIPTWNNFVNHPDYDSFWQKNSTLSYIHEPMIPQLHVGGYYDQEDLNGPQLMYAHMEKKDTFNRNHIVLGPWYHGQWARGKGDSIAKISFGSETGVAFREIEKKWFDYYLKGIGDGKFEEAYAFQTGSNTWKTYNAWPPENSTVKPLYAGADGSAGFAKPIGKGMIRYVSDPKNPVPYRQLPIEMTYGTGSRWRPWQVEDQRFVYDRPDVLHFTTDTLTEDLTVTGAITAHLFASTTGSDADWVVKLIDVFPAFDAENLLQSGYQFPVTMEVFRGRYRTSFSKPVALVPGKPEEFTIGLHQINHVFKKGHRIMFQVQSSWFPMIDMNPQTFVPNIFLASPGDFKKATQTVYFSAEFPTRIDLPVMK